MPASIYVSRLLLFVLAVASCSVTQAQQLTPDSYDQLVPAGKETDAIYGDFAISNTAAKAVVAVAKPTRNANMTVRDVGGCLIDFAVTESESDQLSCFYPGRRKFSFSDSRMDGDSVVVTSPGSDKRPSCEVRYSFASNAPVLSITSTWINTTRSDWTLALEDDLRSDGGKEEMVRSPNGTVDVFYFNDLFWQQAYVISANGYRIRCNGNSRESVLAYESLDGQPAVMKPGASYQLVRHITVAKELSQALATAETDGGSLADFGACKFAVTLQDGQPADAANLELRTDGHLRGVIRTDANGAAECRLPAGIYTLNAKLDGVSLFPKDAVTIDVRDGDNIFDLQSNSVATGRLEVHVNDGDGKPIPAKIELIGSGETSTPNWGPETAEHFVKNLAYTADGSVATSVITGTYDVIISHGPEYDALFTKLEIKPGELTKIDAKLPHVVKTPGWISSDFHSHSSPSGDNTGSQRGRVLNLAAEHIEFAPCTEHNRVSTYAGHIAELKLQPFLATVSGMELTGKPLPLNHQNVFPMRYTPRTQDGGGPVTDGSPEVQIERLALWDDRSEKLIQQNHPDIGWLFYDKDGDGTPDEGFSRSFPFIDVMEIHPIDRLLRLTKFDERNGKPFGNQRMLNWLQLLNHGFRIYGVVNTDAHYNFHGSGWLRNWIQSTTDDPAEIDATEMVTASQQGRLIMSNGPYLEATFTAVGQGDAVVSGQDLVAKSGKVTVDVRVQCPNWFDVDRVFVLINGRAADEFTFTRADHPEMFSDDVVKFERTLQLTLQADSHLVVATGHQTELLGDVMGPDGGRQHPTALTNPVFVDVDGGGFQPNKDTLDFPLPVKFAARPK